MSGKAIVLDANILIRAVLGQRVRQLLLEYAQNVKFFAPDVAYADAKEVPPRAAGKARRQQRCGIARAGHARVHCSAPRI
jgi:hypothetical protein